MIIYNSKIPSIVGAEGMTIWPFILISHSKGKCPDWLLKHEQVHINQQIRWWFVPFYVAYMWDYFKGRLDGLDHNKAYRNIRFEKEAYEKYNGGLK